MSGDSKMISIEPSWCRLQNLRQFGSKCQWNKSMKKTTCSSFVLASPIEIATTFLMKSVIYELWIGGRWPFICPPIWVDPKCQTLRKQHFSFNSRGAVLLHQRWKKAEELESLIKNVTARFATNHRIFLQQKDRMKQGRIFKWSNAGTELKITKLHKSLRSQSVWFYESVVGGKYSPFLNNTRSIQLAFQLRNVIYSHKSSQSIAKNHIRAGPFYFTKKTCQCCIEPKHQNWNKPYKSTNFELSTWFRALWE